MKPIELINLIRNDFGIPLQTTKLYDWEKNNLLGEVEKKGQRSYTDENIKKAKDVAVLKFLYYSTYEIKRGIDKKDLKLRLDDYRFKILPYIESML